MLFGALMLRKQFDQPPLSEVVGDLGFDQANHAEACARELDQN